jgi:hypothetical protein
MGIDGEGDFLKVADRNARAAQRGGEGEKVELDEGGEVMVVVKVIVDAVACDD